MKTEAVALDQLARVQRIVKKLEKRERQRRANLGRALKMRAARISASVALSIPDKLPALNVGCSGWFYWHWKKIFYPEELPMKDWFKHYSQTFSTVELNAPFYAWPTVNGVQQWLKQARNSKIIYSVKACELITHVKRFCRTKSLVKDFGFIGDMLGRRMGCFLFQLPPSYRYTNSRLKGILGQLDPSRRNVVEFRHSSWWNNKVYAAFEKAGIIFCSCSGPKLPDELIMTASEVYIRFHGLTKWYRHNYTSEELSVWVGRIKQCGCNRVWAYFNNDRDGNAINNAAEFLRQLKRIPMKHFNTR